MLRLIEICIIGFSISPLLDYCGMLYGDDGVRYYNENHQKPANALAYSLSLVSTFYGTMLCIPVFLRLNRKQGINLQQSIFGIYFFHYCTIHLFGGVTFFILFQFPLRYAMREYQNSLSCAFFGATVVVSSVLYQEYFVFADSGNNLRQMKNIVNTILYANYTVVQYFWKMLGYHF